MLWNRPSMGVACSSLWAPDFNQLLDSPSHSSYKRSSHLASSLGDWDWELSELPSLYLTFIHTEALELDL